MEWLIVSGPEDNTPFISSSVSPLPTIIFANQGSPSQHIASNNQTTQNTFPNQNVLNASPVSQSLQYFPFPNPNQPDFCNTTHQSFQTPAQLYLQQPQGMQLMQSALQFQQPQNIQSLQPNEAFQLIQPPQLQQPSQPPQPFQQQQPSQPPQIFQTPQLLQPSQLQQSPVLLTLPSPQPPQSPQQAPLQNIQHQNSTDINLVNNDSLNSAEKNQLMQGVVFKGCHDSEKRPPPSTLLQEMRQTSSNANTPSSSLASLKVNTQNTENPYSVANIQSNTPVTNDCFVDSDVSDTPMISSPITPVSSDACSPVFDDPLRSYSIANSSNSNNPPRNYSIAGSPKSCKPLSSFSIAGSPTPNNPLRSSSFIGSPMSDTPMSSPSNATSSPTQNNSFSSYSTANSPFSNDSLNNHSGAGSSINNNPMSNYSTVSTPVSNKSDRKLSSTSVTMPNSPADLLRTESSVMANNATSNPPTINVPVNYESIQSDSITDSIVNNPTSSYPENLIPILNGVNPTPISNDVFLVWDRNTNTLTNVNNQQVLNSLQVPLGSTSSAKNEQKAPQIICKQIEPSPPKTREQSNTKQYEQFIETSHSSLYPSHIISSSPPVIPNTKIQRLIPPSAISGLLNKKKDAVYARKRSKRIASNTIDSNGKRIKRIQARKKGNLESNLDQLTSLQPQQRMVQNKSYFQNTGDRVLLSQTTDFVSVDVQENNSSCPQIALNTISDGITSTDIDDASLDEQIPLDLSLKSGPNSGSEDIPSAIIRKVSEHPTNPFKNFSVTNVSEESLRSKQNNQCNIEKLGQTSEIETGMKINTPSNMCSSGPISNENQPRINFPVNYESTQSDSITDSIVNNPTSSYPENLIPISNGVNPTPTSNNGFLVWDSYTNTLTNVNDQQVLNSLQVPLGSTSSTKDKPKPPQSIYRQIAPAPPKPREQSDTKKSKQSIETSHLSSYPSSCSPPFIPTTRTLIPQSLIPGLLNNKENAVDARKGSKRIASNTIEYNGKRSKLIPTRKKRNLESVLNQLTPVEPQQRMVQNMSYFQNTGDRVLLSQTTDFVSVDVQENNSSCPQIALNTISNRFTSTEIDDASLDKQSSLDLSLKFRLNPGGEDIPSAIRRKVSEHPTNPSENFSVTNVSEESLRSKQNDGCNIEKVGQTSEIETGMKINATSNMFSSSPVSNENENALLNSRMAYSSQNQNSLGQTWTDSQHEIHSENEKIQDPVTRNFTTNAITDQNELLLNEETTSIDRKRQQRVSNNNELAPFSEADTNQLQQSTVTYISDLKGEDSQNKYEIITKIREENKSFIPRNSVESNGESLNIELSTHSTLPLSKNESSSGINRTSILDKIFYMARKKCDNGFENGTNSSKSYNKESLRRLACKSFKTLEPAQCPTENIKDKNDIRCIKLTNKNNVITQKMTINQIQNQQDTEYKDKEHNSGKSSIESQKYGEQSLHLSLSSKVLRSPGQHGDKKELFKSINSTKECNEILNASGKDTRSKRPIECVNNKNGWVTNTEYPCYVNEDLRQLVRQRGQNADETKYMKQDNIEVINNTNDTTMVNELLRASGHERSDILRKCKNNEQSLYKSSYENETLNQNLDPPPRPEPNDAKDEGQKAKQSACSSTKSETIPRYYNQTHLVTEAGRPENSNMFIEDPCENTILKQSSNKASKHFFYYPRSFNELDHDQTRAYAKVTNPNREISNCAIFSSPQTFDQSTPKQNSNDLNNLNNYFLPKRDSNSNTKNKTANKNVSNESALNQNEETKSNTQNHLHESNKTHQYSNANVSDQNINTSSMSFQNETNISTSNKIKFPPAHSFACFKNNNSPVRKLSEDNTNINNANPMSSHLSSGSNYCQNENSDSSTPELVIDENYDDASFNNNNYPERKLSKDNTNINNANPVSSHLSSGSNYWQDINEHSSDSSIPELVIDENYNDEESEEEIEKDNSTKYDHSQLHSSYLGPTSKIVEHKNKFSQSSLSTSMLDEHHVDRESNDKMQRNTNTNTSLLYSSDTRQWHPKTGSYNISNPFSIHSLIKDKQYVDKGNKKEKESCDIIKSDNCLFQPPKDSISKNVKYHKYSANTDQCPKSIENINTDSLSARQIKYKDMDTEEYQFENREDYTLNPDICTVIKDSMNVTNSWEDTQTSSCTFHSDDYGVSETRDGSSVRSDNKAQTYNKQERQNARTGFVDFKDKTSLKTVLESEINEGSPSNFIPKDQPEDWSASSNDSFILETSTYPKYRTEAPESDPRSVAENMLRGERRNVVSISGSQFHHSYSLSSPQTFNNQINPLTKINENIVDNTYTLQENTPEEALFWSHVSFKESLSKSNIEAPSKYRNLDKNNMSPNHRQAIQEVRTGDTNSLDHSIHKTCISDTKNHGYATQQMNFNKTNNYGRATQEINFNETNNHGRATQEMNFNENNNYSRATQGMNFNENNNHGHETQNIDFNETNNHGHETQEMNFNKTNNSGCATQEMNFNESKNCRRTTQEMNYNETNNLGRATREMNFNEINNYGRATQESCIGDAINHSHATNETYINEINNCGCATHKNCSRDTLNQEQAIPETCMDETNYYRTAKHEICQDDTINHGHGTHETSIIDTNNYGCTTNEICIGDTKDHATRETCIGDINKSHNDPYHNSPNFETNMGSFVRKSILDLSSSRFAGTINEIHTFDAPTEEDQRRDGGIKEFTMVSNHDEKELLNSKIITQQNYKGSANNPNDKQSGTTQLRKTGEYHVGAEEWYEDISEASSQSDQEEDAIGECTKNETNRGNLTFVASLINGSPSPEGFHSLHQKQKATDGYKDYKMLGKQEEHIENESGIRQLHETKNSWNENGFKKSDHFTSYPQTCQDQQYIDQFSTMQNASASSQHRSTTIEKDGLAGNHTHVYQAQNRRGVPVFETMTNNDNDGTLEFDVYNKSCDRNARNSSPSATHLNPQVTTEIAKNPIFTERLNNNEKKKATTNIHHEYDHVADSSKPIKTRQVQDNDFKEISRTSQTDAQSQGEQSSVVGYNSEFKPLNLTINNPETPFDEKLGSEVQQSNIKQTKIFDFFTPSKVKKSSGLDIRGIDEGLVIQDKVSSPNKRSDLSQEIIPSREVNPNQNGAVLTGCHIYGSNVNELEEQASKGKYLVHNYQSDQMGTRVQQKRRHPSQNNNSHLKNSLDLPALRITDKNQYTSDTRGQPKRSHGVFRRHKSDSQAHYNRRVLDTDIISSGGKQEDRLGKLNSKRDASGADGISRGNIGKNASYTATIHLSRGKQILLKSQEQTKLQTRNNGISVDRIPFPTLEPKHGQKSDNLVEKTESKKRIFRIDLNKVDVKRANNNRERDVTKLLTSFRDCLARCVSGSYSVLKVENADESYRPFFKQMPQNTMSKQKNEFVQAPLLSSIRKCNSNTGTLTYPRPLKVAKGKEDKVTNCDVCLKIFCGSINDHIERDRHKANVSRPDLYKNVDRMITQINNISRLYSVLNNYRGNENDNRLIQNTICAKHIDKQSSMTEECKSKSKLSDVSKKSYLSRYSTVKGSCLDQLRSPLQLQKSSNSIPDEIPSGASPDFQNKCPEENGPLGPFQDSSNSAENTLLNPSQNCSISNEGKRRQDPTHDCSNRCKKCKRMYEPSRDNSKCTTDKQKRSTSLESFDYGIKNQGPNSTENKTALGLSPILLQRETRNKTPGQSSNKSACSETHLLENQFSEDRHMSESSRLTNDLSDYRVKNKNSEHSFFLLKPINSNDSIIIYAKFAGKPNLSHEEIILETAKYIHYLNTGLSEKSPIVIDSSDDGIKRENDTIKQMPVETLPLNGNGTEKERNTDVSSRNRREKLISYLRAVGGIDRPSSPLIPRLQHLDNIPVLSPYKLTEDETEFSYRYASSPPLLIQNSIRAQNEHFNLMTKYDEDTDTDSSSTQGSSEEKS